MKWISLFFGFYWIFMAILAIMGYISPFCAMCACLLAAFCNFENIFN